jgi:hypothetical protein
MKMFVHRRSRALAIVAAAAFAMLAPLVALGRAEAATSVVWEYTFLLRSRQCVIGAAPTQNGLPSISMSPWSMYEDGKPVPAGTDLIAAVKQLGARGWELAAITSRASLPYTGCLGATSDETWVFKRHH